MPIAHSHPDIEINFLHRGELTYRFGARSIEVPQQQLFIFWAGLPHISSTKTESIMSWVTLPIQHMAQLNISAKNWQALLTGQVFIEKCPQQNKRDQINFPMWSEEFKKDDKQKTARN